MQGKERRATSIFVLWAEQFDESIATIFITEFRKLGLKVKVVGLDGVCPKGRYGLGLVMDLILGDALQLAEDASCIVIPCSLSNFQRVSADPRLQIFLTLAYSGKNCYLITWPDVALYLLKVCRISLNCTFILSIDEQTYSDIARETVRKLVAYL